MALAPCPHCAITPHRWAWPGHPLGESETEARQHACRLGSNLETIVYYHYHAVEGNLDPWCLPPGNGLALVSLEDVRGLNIPDPDDRQMLRVALDQAAGVESQGWRYLQRGRDGRRMGNANPSSSAGALEGLRPAPSTGGAPPSGPPGGTPALSKENGKGGKPGGTGKGPWKLGEARSARWRAPQGKGRGGRGGSPPTDGKP